MPTQGERSEPWDHPENGSEPWNHPENEVSPELSCPFRLLHEVAEPQVRHDDHQCPTLGSVGYCDARKRRPLELEVNKRLQIRGDELVEHEDDRDHDETYQPEREHGEVDAVPALPTVW